VPQVGVSTPAAFKAWDELVAHGKDRAAGAKASHFEGDEDSTAEVVLLTERMSPEETRLTFSSKPDRLMELSLAYSFLSAKTGEGRPGTSGIVRDPNPEKKRGLPDENQADAMNDLAENTLLALVRTGIGNDFEEVVFPQYPSLRITKRQLMGSDSDSPAIYAALSGSGSALFGLYRSETDAKAAQQRVQSSGVQAFLTETLPRAEYWERMFAE
jgi:4-diphosphocytidyl-2-C-methyl-D-erythritol kinase